MARDEETRHGLLQSAFDGLLERTRAVVEMLAAAGGGAVSTIPEPVPTAVSRMLASLQQVAEQVPPVTTELNLVIAELHAKRLSIQALQAELAALDGQLEVLERSLRPVESWTRQWSRVKRSLSETLSQAGPASSRK